MSKRKAASYYSLPEIFASPLILLVLSMIGLVAALVADGWADVISWIALAIPIGTIGWMIFAAKRQLRETSDD